MSEVIQTEAPPPCRSYFEYVNKKGHKYYYDTESGTTTYKFPADGIVFDPTTSKVIYTPPGVEAVIKVTKTVTETKVVKKKKKDSLAPEPVNEPVTTDTAPVLPVSVITTTTTTTERVVEKSSSSSSSSDDEDIARDAELRGESFQMRPSHASNDALKDMLSPIPPSPVMPVQPGGGVYGTSLPSAGPVSGMTGLPPELARRGTVAGPTAQPPRNIQTLVQHSTGPVALTGLGPAPPRKSAPRVLRTFSAQEIMCLAFGLDQLFTKGKLKRTLQEYDMEDYARAEFRLTKNKKKRVHVVTSFQEKPLKRPLLKDCPDSLKKKAKVLFQKLLEYTTVVHCKNIGAALKVIIRLLSDDPELVDEFFFQLVKQLTDNPRPGCVMKTWELFLIVASIFPVSKKHHKIILAQIAGYTADADQRISCAATFLYIRFEARYYLGKPLDIARNKTYIETIPQHITKGTTVFGSLLYEMMWCQKSHHPRLLIPYVLYYMVKQLTERNALKTVGIFRVAGSQAITNEILEEVNTNIEAISSRGEVNVLANLLKIWLTELPNPVVPVEMIDTFEEMTESNRHLGFLEKLPQVHRFTLMFIIGFVQDICKNSDVNKMGKSDLATIFGPCLVNPIRSVGQDDPDRVEHLTQLSISFVSRLIDACDPSIVYPVDPFYLENVHISRDKKRKKSKAEDE